MPFFCSCIHRENEERDASMNVNYVSEVAKDAVDVAKKLEDAGEFGQAIDVVTNALKADKKNAWLYAVRGRLHHVKEDFKAAVTDFNGALSLKKDTPTTLHFRGRAKTELGDLEGAFKDFKRCIELQPNAADAYQEIGFLLEAAGEKEGAVVALQKAISLEPQAFGYLAERIQALQDAEQE
ncbi:MAG: tetratricopeptide repeat protein [Deltaproteobacteria bacterium]|nr:tetratricopeptide repeat protein [Deltaproteobacteria bacterium]